MWYHNTAQGATMHNDFTLPSSQLIEYTHDARQRTLDLIADLGDAQLMGPQLDSVNPLLWEIGHIAFFHEVFVLRELGVETSLLDGAEDLYDSFEVAHDDRWGLLLPTREKTLDYMRRVLDQMIERIDSHDPTPKETYLYLLAVFHEDMHAEAFTWTRQTLSYPAPTYSATPKTLPDENRASDDVGIAGGKYLLGATQDQPFVFDNEKWQHEIDLAPFEIARTPVTNKAYAEFVDDGGYEQLDHWSYAGKAWLKNSQAKHPLYWQRDNHGWSERHFDEWRPLRATHPVMHVNWHEAEAYACWAGRRLPTEAEWEMAASMANDSQQKQIFPWGNDPPTKERANLDGAAGDRLNVGACAKGDSQSGCRQMIGNVWEWTASAFYPFPGFIVDHPYREYSAPWFGYHKVLRGGCWATRSRLIRNTFRNFCLPHRRDAFTGFRTCAK